jgi:hypothetical protein
VDCDGSLDATDALQILRHVVGFPGAPACIAQGDTNCDGSIDSTDALRVLRHVAGLTQLNVGC